MKSVRFHEVGGPEVLVFEEVPDPRPATGEVLIRVEAVGLNFADVLRRRGDPYPEASPTPFTLGGEVAGTVEALGEGVAGPPVGTAVYCACRTGGYAQFVAVPASDVIPLPAGLDPVQATALVIQGLTAFLALRDAGRLAAGEAVLVEAAAGGVGSFAVQLAKLSGAGPVIAAASTAEKRDVALGLGADAVVDYTDPAWAAAVRDLTGGPTLTRALAALAPFGRMVVYGLASGETVTVDPQVLTVPNQSVVGFYVGAYFRHRPDLVRTALAEIVGHVAAGRLELRIGTVLPLHRAAEAHRLIEGRRTTGKVVLRPWLV